MPIYIGQTAKLNTRIAAHKSSRSASNLRRTIQVLKRTHPEWKIENNWKPIECVKNGVPSSLIDKYEGFFIAGIYNGTDVPGTRQHPKYPHRSNAQDGPNWGAYKAQFYDIQSDVDKAMSEGTELQFKFAGHEVCMVDDPQYRDGLRDVNIVDSIKEHLLLNDDGIASALQLKRLYDPESPCAPVLPQWSRIDAACTGSSNNVEAEMAETINSLDMRIEVARQTVVAHDNILELHSMLRQYISFYKGMTGLESVDGAEFVKVWNHAKALMQDYVPHADNISQKFAHSLTMQAYKKGIEVIGNGDSATLIPRKSALFMLDMLQKMVSMRSSAGGKSAKSFQSMMAWCTFDTKLEKHATLYDKLKRLRDHLENEFLSESQRVEIEKRIQEGQFRLGN